MYKDNDGDSGEKEELWRSCWFSFRLFTTRHETFCKELQLESKALFCLERPASIRSFWLFYIFPQGDGRFN